MAKWNIKQDESTLTTFSYEPYSLDEEDECSLHEFSKGVTDTDTYCISLVIDLIMNRRNSFKFSGNRD